MNTCMKTAKNRARAEIFEVLLSDMRISTKQIDTILAKQSGATLRLCSAAIACQSDKR